MKKKLEDMNVQELLKEVSNVHKKTNFKPEKSKTDEEGSILLNPNNKNDTEWFENDKDYHL